jgi:integrase
VLETERLMMTKNGKKVGRRATWFRDAQDRTYEGLVKQTDGRFRIVATGERFSAADDADAIRIFRERQSKRKRETVTLLAPSDDHGAQDILSVDSPAFWQAVRRAILHTPQLAAERTGIEQLGYLTGIKPPPPLPTFDELETTWRTHFKKSLEQRRRVLHAWTDFKNTTKVGSLREITPEVVIAYRDEVYGRNLTGKMQQNIFSRIRRLLTFARGRAVAVKEIGEVVEVLKLLTPSDTTVSLDPQPIEADDWKKLLDTAEGEDKAMILLMLNGAFYIQEVVRLQWDDIDGGCLVTNRRKAGQIVRACTLWAETIEALKGIKRRGDFLFYSYQGLPLGVKGAEKRFRQLRDDAEVTVTASQLRDGAATAAAQANVNVQLLNVVLGHRSGINDHYIRRNAKMVQPATDAIYAHYFG